MKRMYVSFKRTVCCVIRIQLSAPTLDSAVDGGVEHVQRPFVIAQKCQRTPLDQRNYSVTGVHYLLHTAACCTVAIG